ncbi:TPA: DUF2195 family protein [Vibrio campbellii]|nr:DUF2195 family protein [Vibrio campbellii]
MLVRACCILFFCWTSLLSFAQQAASGLDDFENILSNCVSIESSDVYSHNNLTLVNMRLTLDKSIGSCGCKSAIASLTFESIPFGAFTFDFALIKSRTISVPLVLDNKLNNIRSIKGALACGNN